MNVVFDVGRVLIQWEPEPLLADILGGEAALAEAATRFDFHAWHTEQDRGRTVTAALKEARETHPDLAPALATFYERWLEAVPAPIDGTVAILEEVAAAGQPIYAITNFSAELWPITVAHYPFLGRFRDVVVSGAERLVKPDPAIYELFLERNALAPESCVFIDDREENVTAAAALGIDAIRFETAEALRPQLQARGLL